MVPLPPWSNGGHYSKIHIGGGARLLSFRFGVRFVLAFTTGLGFVFDLFTLGAGSDNADSQGAVAGVCLHFAASSARALKTSA
jgi:hypothetical protein